MWIIKKEVLHDAGRNSKSYGERIECQRSEGTCKIKKIGTLRCMG